MPSSRLAGAASTTRICSIDHSVWSHCRFANLGWLENGLHMAIQMRRASRLRGFQDVQRITQELAPIADDS